MRHKIIRILIAAAIAVTIALGVMAQNQRQQARNHLQTSAAPAAIVNLEGVVDSVNMEPGQGLPTFTLRKADGSAATIIASPFRVILRAEFKISIGDIISATVFPSPQHENSFVAMELINLSTGSKLKLRNEDGLPVVGFPGAGQHICGYCLGPGSF